MVNLGDRVCLRPQTFGEITKERGTVRDPLPGTVTYIHPRGRFCTVSFECRKDGPLIRESFQLIEGEIKE